nr:hypothetical protein [Tanacetum cinerariifolium]
IVEDADMTDADQGGADQQNVSQELGFEQVEEDAHVILTPVLDTQKADEPIQSSYTTARHATTVPEITSIFTTTIHPPPPFINPLLQQATPNPTPTTSEATIVVLALPDIASVFRFNDRVTNFERDLSELKQVDQYAQAISLLPTILDRYMENKLGEAIHKAIQSYNVECREEAQAEKQEYINNAFATLMIERNVTKSIEIAVLARSFSQPKSTYEASASLSEYKLTKIILDKMEERKSHLRSDNKKELYDALVKSYKTDKDLFNAYGRSLYIEKESRRETQRSRPLHWIRLRDKMKEDQEFDMGNNDEQPADNEVSKADWFKKPKRPPTPDSD